MKRIINLKKENLGGATDKVRLLYFTDPICSHCWAMEPELMKFLYHYGDLLDVEIIMGGLLEKWDGFSDGANDIESAGDVYRHWREVSEQSGMPIKASVWLSDPISSSYPASQVVNIVEKYHPELKVAFLRRLREAVFVFDENVSREEVLEALLDEMGLDSEFLMERAFAEEGHKLLVEDLQATRNYRVSSFPTVLLGYGDKSLGMVGQRSCDELEEALLTLVGRPIEKKAIPPLAEILKETKRIYHKEIEVLYELSHQQVRDFLRKQEDEELSLVEFYDGYYLEWRG